MSNAESSSAKLSTSLRRNKIISAAEAVALIRDRDTVSTCGFAGTAFPENLAVALEQRFLETDGPRT
jgi:propionate CoA-transferase